MGRAGRSVRAKRRRPGPAQDHPPGGSRKAARRRLLRTITVEGEHLYPLWQFDGNRVLGGLAEVLALFPEQAVDGWTVAAWLRTPDPDLGEAPLDVLAGGGLDRVRTVARSAARGLAA